MATTTLQKTKLNGESSVSASQHTRDPSPLPRELARFDRAVLSVEGSKGWGMESQFGPRMQLSTLRVALSLAHQGIQIGRAHPESVRASNDLFRCAADIIWGNSFGIGGGRNFRDFRMAHRVTKALDSFREALVEVLRSRGDTRSGALQNLDRTIREIAAEGREVVRGLSNELPRRKADSFVHKYLGAPAREALSTLRDDLACARTPEERALLARVEAGVSLMLLGIEHMGAYRKYNATTLWAGARDIFPRVPRETNAPWHDAIDSFNGLSGIVSRESKDIPHQLAARLKLVLETAELALQKISYRG